MSDKEIVERIHDLVDQYHGLAKQHHGIGLGPEQRQRLTELQREVDRAWDVLRRERAAKRLEETTAPGGSLRPAEFAAGPVRSAKGG
jgi:hypothetical protein